MKPLKLYERALICRGRAASTRHVHLRTVERLLGRAGKPLKQIRAQDVRAYLASRSVTASTRAHELGWLRSFFACMVEARKIKRDPTEGLTAKRGSPGPQLVLSLTAVAKLLAAASALESRQGVSEAQARALALRDRALVELLYGVGLRASEAGAIQVVDLDLSTGTLFVRRVKRGDWSVLPMPPASLPHLRRYLVAGRPVLAAHGRDCGRLLLTRGGRPVLRDTVFRVVEKLAKRAGVRAHPHAFRRALASHLVEAGVSVVLVQRLLGHANLETTAAYVAVSRAALRRVVGLLDAQGPVAAESTRSNS